MLGIALFVRDGKRIALTEAGKALVPTVQQIIDSYNQLLIQTADFHASRDTAAGKPFLYAASIFTENSWELLKCLPRSAPMNNVKLVEMDPEVFLSDVAMAATSSLMLLCLDVAELERLRTERRFVFEPLFAIQLYIRVSKMLISPRKKQVTADELIHLPIIVANDVQLKHQIRDLNLDVADLDIVGITSSRSIIDESVSKGQAAAFTDSLCAFLRKGTGNELFLPIKGAKPSQAGFAYPIGHRLDPCLSDFKRRFKSFITSSCHYYLHSFPPQAK